MGPVSKSALSLGFWGNDVDPEEISKLLGGEPTVGVAKGGTWQTGTGVLKTARTGSWRRRIERSQPADLSSQLAAALEALTDDLAIWQGLSSRHRGRVFCGLFLREPNEGLILDPDVMRKISERGLSLDLDIYAAHD